MNGASVSTSGLLAILVASATVFGYQAEGTEEPRYEATWESLDARPIPEWFNEAKFGVFICWGPYSVPSWAPRGQYAEWYGWRMRREGPTRDFHRRVYGEDFTYEDFGPLMTGELFDAAEWADVIERSGARYVAMTANYHDGFALFPSPYAKGWNAMDTGPKRDVLAEVAEAVTARGVRFGIYYSLYEWFHPLWTLEATRPRYVEEHYLPQLKEVVTRYRPYYIFADGEWEGDEVLWRSTEVTAWLYGEAPTRDELVINDRFGGGRDRHGDVYSSEYGGAEHPPTHPWEENRGIGASYGYNRNERLEDYDTPAELLRMLCKTAGNGGNYLLDIGPTADGRIPVIMQERLLQIGEWLEVNGEAIYGTKASPFWPRRLDWGTCTYAPEPERIFALVYGEGGEEVLLPGLATEIAATRVLGAPDRAVPWESRPEGVALRLPEVESGGLPWVVAVELAGAPRVDLAAREEPGVGFRLRAADARIHGSSPRYEKGGGKDDIGYWGNPEDFVSWELRLEEPGELEVLLTYSCATGCGGSAFEVLVGGEHLTGRTQETGAWNRFSTHALGCVTLDAAGQCTVEVRPVVPPTWRSMGLQEVRLARTDSRDR